MSDSDQTTLTGDSQDQVQVDVSENQPRSFLTIERALMGLTVVLVFAILGLTINIILSASQQQDSARQSMELNEASDSLTQMTLALATERTAASTAFGFQGIPPEEFSSQAAIQRRTAVVSYEVFLEHLEQMPDFQGRAEKAKALREAYAVYDEMGEQLALDLEASEERRVLRRREMVRTLNDLIEAAADLRNTFELAFNTGKARIEGVKQLKRQLWLMLEYSSRDSAAIGENIASGEPLSSIKLQIVSQYGGVVRSAWELVQNIAESDLADSGIRSQVDAIENQFFGEFDLLRDDVYTAAEFEEPYPVTAVEWLEASRTAAEPLNRMSAAADQLARRLNEEAVSSASQAFALAIGGIVVVIAVGVFAGWMVRYRVVRPINRLSATMHRLAQGHLETEVPHTEGGDEVGAMARSVQIFKENAIERQRLEAEQRDAAIAEQERRAREEKQRMEAEAAEREREETRERKAREERRQAMLQMADQFEASVMEVVNGLSTSAKNMEEAAQGLAATAKQTSNQSDVVSKAAEQASSNANMVASAAEELSSSVREITGQTTQSSASARDAVGRTETAAKDVANLESAALKIGEVVQLINDIAEQTNLLALNATIEAARAGDAGKGFAVVASEVKSLASQTGRATEEISGQVESMQQATNTAVKAMEAIRGIIGDIESKTVSIASAVEEQDASTQEIARNVAEVSTGTEEVTRNIRGVNDGAASTGSAANNVLDAAQQLTRQSDALRDQVDRFLNQIRASD